MNEKSGALFGWSANENLLFAWDGTGRESTLVFAAMSYHTYRRVRSSREEKNTRIKQPRFLLSDVRRTFPRARACKSNPTVELIDQVKHNFDTCGTDCFFTPLRAPPSSTPYLYLSSGVPPSLPPLPEWFLSIEKSVIPAHLQKHIN